MDTLILYGDVAPAAEILSAGGLVGVPTETVYGLAANALNAAAVGKIYEVKGRPEVKPVSLLIPDLQTAGRFCRDIPEAARALAAAFWPGPLTMILYRRDSVPDIVTAGGDTVGVRCPAHEKTLELLRLSGLPLAAPSANTSGCPSPKTAADVLSYFDGKIDCVIDGGECSVGVESTIVDMTCDPPRILRRGGLPGADIERVLGVKTL